VFPTIIEIAPFILFGFKLGPFALHTYGLFVAAGFLLGIAWSMREARARGLSPDTVSDSASTSSSEPSSARALFMC